MAKEKGSLAATRSLLSSLWEFLVDSTPARRRLRFGDADYDWDYRVNTSSGALAWRDRLLGIFHSPYQPTEPTLFKEMLDDLLTQANLDASEFTFVDLGSGKGRTLLMASEYPFRRIIGVELLPALHAAALDNIAQYKHEPQKCFALEAVCGDAARFPPPEGPLLIYLFNPLPEPALRKVQANLAESLRRRARPIYVLYHNPQLERVFAESPAWRKTAGTHQYSIFTSAP
jgi:SAM-dependent methyltransferase